MQVDLAVHFQHFRYLLCSICCNVLILIQDAALVLYYNRDRMKTISHPSAELQLYNRVLQFIEFPVSFCYSVENLWITALMISLETPNIIDSFIWITPNIITILLRPALIAYVHKVVSPRQAELSLVSYFLMGGLLGCGLVAVCSQYFTQNYSIAVCTLGWTTMDVCFEMVVFFAEKAKARLSQFGYEQIQQNKNYSSIQGQVLGYFVSFCLCYVKNAKSMKKFYACTSQMYFIAMAVTGVYWIALYLSSKDPFIISNELKQSMSQLPPVTKNIAFYLPGYHEVRSSSGFDRWLLTLHFTYLFIVDTLLIYGSMWIAMAYEQLGEKQGVSYNMGMKEGSLVLLLFTLVSYANPGRFVVRQNSRVTNYLKYFMGLLLVICAVACLLFVKTNHQFIFLLAMLIGIADGFYKNQIEPELQTQYPVWESSQELINRIEKIVILCPMPFFVMIVLGRNDISDCLLCMPIAVVMLLVLSNYWKDHAGLKTKTKMGKVDKHH